MISVPYRRILAATAAVAAVAAAGGGVGLSSPSSSASRVYKAPSGIAADCSVDVTRRILAWVASVPDNSLLSFSKHGCYRIEGTLQLRNRTGLDFDGNGSTFRSLDPPSDHRSLWRIVDSQRIRLRDMTIDGSYTKGGTFTSTLQHAHAVDVDGASIEVEHVTMRDVAGDCVYFGRGDGAALTLSSGSVHDSICSGTSRNAISVVAGENILVRRVTTRAIGYNVFDVEANLDSGWGSNGVTFDGNEIGSYAKNAYSIVESAPVTNQSFTNNRIVGQGLKIAIADPAGAGYRAYDVTIRGNRSNVAQAPAAINVDQVDGLTMTGNTVPMTGGPMAAIVASCGLHIAGNRFPGGTTQALVYPSVCSFTPARGSAGSTVVVHGSGFNRASAVRVNGTPASFKLDSDAQLTLVVPHGAVSGRISVTAPNGTASSSARFTVLP